MLDGRENFRECTAEDVGYAGAVVLPGGTDGFFFRGTFSEKGTKALLDLSQSLLELP